MALKKFLHCDLDLSLDIKSINDQKENSGIRSWKGKESNFVDNLNELGG